MCERVKDCFKLRPDMGRRDWETAINRLIELDTKGKTVENFNHWNSDEANLYKSISTKQISNRPTLLSDMVEAHAVEYQAQQEAEQVEYYQAKERKRTPRPR